MNTSLTPTEIINLSAQVLSLGKFDIEQLRLPIDGAFREGRYNSMWVINPDIERNTQALHNFINNIKDEDHTDEY